jgi:hypothetical protein
VRKERGCEKDWKLDLQGVDVPPETELVGVVCSAGAAPCRRSALVSAMINKAPHPLFVEFPESWFVLTDQARIGYGMLAAFLFHDQ